MEGLFVSPMAVVAIRDNVEAAGSGSGLFDHMF